jgi:small-conductance mechanosensitive channel
MEILDKELFHIGTTPITIVTLIIFILTLIITVGLAFLIRQLLLRTLLKKEKLNRGVAFAYTRIIYYIVLFTGFLIAIHTAGINISVIFAGGAALLVGIGFGIQNIANNFISGLILLIERPIKEGDFVEVDGMLGTVKEISARSTKIITNSNVTIIVPNSKFLETKVINHSFLTTSWVDISLNLPYHTDLNKVTSLLIEIASNHPLVLKEPLPSVSISEFSDSFIKLKVWVCTDQAKLYGIIRSDIMKEIVKQFVKNKIEFAVPNFAINLKEKNVG